ncbi:hypothetical protein KCP75_04560 [Salmonella enterica subsp. enterica]|nr:hypothetical protein KCP75_04560 [Salmonella enterica subsp. enterica]
MFLLEVSLRLPEWFCFIRSSGRDFACAIPQGVAHGLRHRGWQAGGRLHGRHWLPVAVIGSCVFTRYLFQRLPVFGWCLDGPGRRLLSEYRIFSHLKKRTQMVCTSAPPLRVTACVR